MVSHGLVPLIDAHLFATRQANGWTSSDSKYNRWPPLFPHDGIE